MEEEILVICEGQQHRVKQSIAQDDNLLRQLFAGLSPELAGAEIQRNGDRINIVPRKGTKGSTTETVLQALDAAPSEVDPTIKLAVQLQHLEIHQGFQVEQASAISQQIEQAIEQSQSQRAAIKQTLQRLDQGATISVISIGF